MNMKHYLLISGIVGGVIGSVLTALLVSPVTAQRDKFGVVECSELRIVDEDGNWATRLGVGAPGGYVMAFGKDDNSMVMLGFGKDGPAVTIGNEDGIAEILVSEDGGDFRVYGKDGQLAAVLGTSAAGGGGRSLFLGKDGAPKVTIGITEQGDGIFSVAGKSEGRVILSIDDNGSGVVETYDKNGYRQQ